MTELGDIPVTTQVPTAAEVAAGFQPLDSDLTALAALSSTSFGRALLELANSAALLAAAGAAAASHAHSGADITSGTVVDARIDAAIARDSEVTSAIAALSSVYQPLDSDLTALAALATNAAGRGVLTLADPNADRILFWDDSAGVFTFLVPGTNLTITGTTIDAASGGGSGDSITVAIAQTAHGLAVGDVVSYSGTAYVKAKADTAANAEVVGVVSVVTDANNFTLLTSGKITLSGLTAGTVYFLSDGTAGLLTTTEPTTVGSISKPLLVATSSSAGYVFNWRGLAVGVSPAQPYVHLREEQATGTQGGTFTTGAWRTRTLNTEVTDSDGICSLASNQITLAAGTYDVVARAPAFACNGHQARLQNVTDGTTLLLGSSEQSGGADASVTNSEIVGRITVATGKALEVQHRCSTTSNTYGLGVQCASGSSEVYTQVEFRKVA